MYNHKKFSLIFLVINIIISGCIRPTTTKITHPDTGFKYVINYDPAHKRIAGKKYIFNPDTENMNESIILKGTYRTHTFVAIDMNMYISDAYFFLNETDSLIDIVEHPPLFKGKDQSKFCKWVLKKNKFKINSAYKLDSSCKGHVILEITIDKKGNLSHIKPLLIKDDFFDGEIYQSFEKTITRSPLWVPATDNGEKVDSKYIIGLVWGHYLIRNRKLY